MAGLWFEKNPTFWGRSEVEKPCMPQRARRQIECWSFDMILKIARNLRTNLFRCSDMVSEW